MLCSRECGKPFALFVNDFVKARPQLNHIYSLLNVTAVYSTSIYFNIPKKPPEYGFVNCVEEKGCKTATKTLT